MCQLRSLGSGQSGASAPSLPNENSSLTILVKLIFSHRTSYKAKLTVNEESGTVNEVFLVRAQYSDVIINDDGK